MKIHRCTECVCFKAFLRLFLKQNKHMFMESSTAQYVCMLHMNESIIGPKSHSFSQVMSVLFSDMMIVSWAINQLLYARQEHWECCSTPSKSINLWASASPWTFQKMMTFQAGFKNIKNIIQDLALDSDWCFSFFVFIWWGGGVGGSKATIVLGDEWGRWPTTREVRHTLPPKPSSWFTHY